MGERVLHRRSGGFDKMEKVSLNFSCPPAEDPETFPRVRDLIGVVRKCRGRFFFRENGGGVKAFPALERM